MLKSVKFENLSILPAIYSFCVRISKASGNSITNCLFLKYLIRINKLKTTATKDLTPIKIGKIIINDFLVITLYSSNKIDKLA